MKPWCGLLCDMAAAANIHETVSMREAQISHEIEDDDQRHKRNHQMILYQQWKHARRTHHK